jgi:tRNA threonylcarbamoyladenosine biosynthesis protein TsaB
VALLRGEQVSEAFELTPRRHNERVFVLLAELLGGGDLRGQGIDAIAYGCGPGSFTGLRIAASVVQGLAYANQLPCVPVSTLLAQAQGAYRRGVVSGEDTVLTTLDARIGELYWAIAGITDGLATLHSGPFVSKPAELSLPSGSEPLAAIGSGLAYLDSLASTARERIMSVEPDAVPRAADMIPLALDALQKNNIQRAQDVSPVYVRDQVNWKKLDQQGRR